MLPTNSSYYNPQGHPCYYPSAVQSAPHSGYFHPYHNFGLAAAAPHIPQPQIPVPSGAANDSGIHSQPPSSPDEDDKENVVAQANSNASNKSKEATLTPEERRKYREKRDRNNMAAKLSRAHRKQREQKLSQELLQAHEINKRLQDELAIFQDQQSRIIQSIHQIINQTKASGGDVTDLVRIMQECTNSMMSMNQQNPALMHPPQGFPTFF